MKKGDFLVLVVVFGCGISLHDYSSAEVSFTALYLPHNDNILVLMTGSYS